MNNAVFKGPFKDIIPLYIKYMQSQGYKYEAGIQQLKALDEYFGVETLKVIVKQPLVATNTLDKFDIICNVKGGGISGQAGAIRHGIARALLQANSEYRPILKSSGFLTRDARMKERKKYGLKKARKAPQFSKR